MARTAQSKRKVKSRSARIVIVKSDGSLKVVSRKPTHGATKLMAGKVDTKVFGRAGKGTVTEQRVFGADGRLKTVYTIDSGSGTFGSDLGYAFKKNVAKARRENKKKFGITDATIQKG